MPPHFTPDRWNALESLLDAALEHAPDERRSFVDATCAGNSELHADMMQLLSDIGRQDSLLDRPAAEHFGSLLVDEVEQMPTVLLDRYRIEGVVGRGGMATVYRARDLRHERFVAVKVLHPHLAAALGPDRFLAEIRTTARLQHPHILPLHDSGDDSGVLFYAMPYVEGESLRHWLDRERQLPIADVVRIASEVASALDAAHRQDVIHRDIKPENILLHNGAALLADFGIALALGGAQPRLTQAGFALGTPQYMSPEQATSDAAIDGRADVYALGSVVFEMLAGEPPFMGATPAAIVAKRAAMPPPSPRVLRAALPAAIDTVVARALARERVDRYHTAGEFANALRSAFDQSESSNVASESSSSEAERSESARRTRLVSWPGRRVTLMLAMLACSTVGTFIVSRARGTREAAAALDPSTVVVIPFGITGADSSRPDLSEAIVYLTTPLLTGEGGLRGFDPQTGIRSWARISRRREATSDVARDVARSVGAGKALFGTLVFASNRVTLTASIVDARRGDVVPLVPVTGSADSLQALADRIVAQMLVRVASVPEQSVGTLCRQSLPVLRAYLDGRAAARLGHTADAVQSFTRALEIDSTFALASFDLAIATTKLVRQQRVCRNDSCRSASVVPGFRDSGAESDDAVFDRAIRLAREFRERLTPRDLPLLGALLHTQGGTARALLADFQQAEIAAPDRAETQYFLGLILLYQGFAVGYSDPLVQAETRFLRSLTLDTAYILPLARLVDVAAYEGDTAKLERYARWYLSRDSTGENADFVRWRVAVGTADAAALARIRSRFNSLSVPTLSQIVTASQMSGAALEDGDRAARLVIDRSADPGERGYYWGHMLALNRGRPRAADSLLRLRAEHDSSRLFFPHAFTTWDAMFGQGDSAAAEAASWVRIRRLMRDTTTEARRAIPGNDSSGRSPQEISQDAQAEVYQEALWTWSHGQLQTSAELTRWLRAHGGSEVADVTDMLIATDGQRSDAALLRAHVDSAARSGCCKPPNHIELLLAVAYEHAANDTAALLAVRRGKWRYPTMYLSTYLLMEGRLAARTGDRDGAIRAYQHYLALRSDPEPRLVAERDSIRNVVSGLRGPQSTGRTVARRVRDWLRHLWP